MLMLCASLSITFSATQSSAADIATKIKFKSEATSTEFDMLGDKQRGSIINGTGQTETKLTVSPDGMSVKIESGTTLIGFLNLTRPDEIKLEDGGKKDMFVLKKEPDGHYKLKTASGDTVYKMKVETYGLKVEDAGQHPIYKVHTHDDKMSLKSIDGKEVLSTKAQLPPIALACFGFDSLRQPQRAALAYALTYLRN